MIEKAYSGEALESLVESVALNQITDAQKENPVGT